MEGGFILGRFCVETASNFQKGFMGWETIEYKKNTGGEPLGGY